MGLRAGVLGAAGFAGIEAVRLLLNHPQFELVVACSDANFHTPLAELYPAFTGHTDLCFSRSDDDLLNTCDVVFLAVPHTAALETAPSLYEQGICVIDLSADFRFNDSATYEQWYKVAHTAPDLLKERAFGLPELFRDDLIKAAHNHKMGQGVLVGCAGCYPTASGLAAVPAIRAGLAEPGSPIVVDAISGVTGAGKKPNERTHYCFANENVEAYGIATHRHTPEIAQIFGLGNKVIFTPHLAPYNRGILSTVTIQLPQGMTAPTQKELDALYVDFYRSAPLVSYLGNKSPRTASVAGTGAAQVSAVVHKDAHAIVVLGALDNLGKGAAGQAIQCANIVFGLEETAGLQPVACAV